MKKIGSFIFITFMVVSVMIAQDQKQVLLTIDGQEISKEEFKRIYTKNNQNIDSGDKMSVEEYLDLFINFKLKVIAAQKQELDTIPSIQREIKKYKDELAKPYLVDEDVLDTLIHEAYRRSKKEVRASHILVKFPKNLTYEDTVFAYNKAKGILERIVKKGEPFGEVARATSDDPSVKKNAGDLGYFTTLQMVYPFETKAYKMQPGKISNPVRTKYGYHIIKKTGERKAKGKVRVAHIMLLAPKSMPAEKRKAQKEKINEIYHKIMQGADFAKMAKKYSDDKGSAKQGGKLPWFGVGRMVPEFEEAAFALDKPGIISTPIKTSIGWHILKLIDKREIGRFEKSKNQLKKRITENPRYFIARDSLIQSLKKTYSFTSDDSLLIKFANAVVNEDSDKVDLSFARNDQLNKQLIKFDENNYTLKDFMNYIKEVPKQVKTKYAGKYFINESFRHFTEEKIIDYEKKKLPEKYPDYKYTIKEYQDGILLFEIMDRKVWSKASTDTAGLKAFFRDHRSDYKWSERFQGKIYKAENDKILHKVKKYKKGGLFRKSWSDEKLLAHFNTNEEKKIEIIERRTYLKGANKIIDHYAWGKNKPDVDNPYFVRGEIIPPQNKTLKQARGAVLADYQNYLEKQWLQQLKEKYKVQVHKNVLETLKN